MTKKQTLDLLMLLSALESWAMSQDKRVPVYLSERLTENVQILSKEILET